MEAPYLDRLPDAAPVAPDAPDILYGAGAAIHTGTPRGPVYGHGGWIPGHVSGLRHDADARVTVAFQVNSDLGVVDDTTDLRAGARSRAGRTRHAPRSHDRAAPASRRDGRGAGGPRIGARVARACPGALEDHVPSGQDQKGDQQWPERCS